MVLQTVFSDNLNPSLGSLTARFTNATAFYIDAPFQSAELEIDVFLQVYFPTQTGERVRNLRLGSLKNGVIKLNETDTETVASINNEFLDSGLEMALFFTPSESIFLEVYVLGKDVDDAHLLQPGNQRPNYSTVQLIVQLLDRSNSSVKRQIVIFISSFDTNIDNDLVLMADGLYRLKINQNVHDISILGKPVVLSKPSVVFNLPQIQEI